MIVEIAATDFKARCLALMDQVARTREEIVITKHGRPVARLLPVEPSAQGDAFGWLAGSVLHADDLIGPIGEEWEAERD